MSNRRYVEFSAEKFKYELFQMYKSKKIGAFQDVQPDLFRNGYTVNEVVYMIRTNRKNINILVYTSIDVRPKGVSGRNTVRVKGSDAVRVVVVIKEATGKRKYKKVHKHLRISTLFSNLETTLENVSNEINNGDFSFDGFREGIGLGVY